LHGSGNPQNDIAKAGLKHVPGARPGVGRAGLAKYRPIPDKGIMTTDDPPIESVLPQLLKALRTKGCAVLQAPPGAGKTTHVPLAMLTAGLPPAGRIVMLEPRRLATRAAAERMAETLGERVGETVGYRMRGDSRTCSRTRIEVVTEGILTRMIQTDPALEGIGAVIFDEFHERSLNTDLGLALTLEARAALREDLLLLVMSATLDAAPVAALMGNAPVVTSKGRSFPVETRWLERPLAGKAHLAPAMAGLVRKALHESTGDILAFLPGESEIRRVAALLNDTAGEIAVHPLHGTLPLRAQRAAIAPAPAGRRKVVLATAIAETSLTIEGVRVVVDCGRTRRARLDPGSGMTRLVTERVTRAEAEQRRGRAGRTAPGLCYRLWSRNEEGSLRPFPPAEIEVADLAGFALELAQWGAGKPEDLALLTPPNPGALAQARALLAELGALDDAGRITGHGRTLAGLPLHPRLGQMLLLAGADAAPLAALLGDRDPLRGAPADISLRLEALADPRAFATSHPHEMNRAALERIRVETRRLERLAPARPPLPGLSAGGMAALAYPDRIGLRRKGDQPRFVLSGGKGAFLAPDDPLAGVRLIVATDLDGDQREARIRLAAPLSESELRRVHGKRIGWHEICKWSRRERRVVARLQERFGAITLDDRHWHNAAPESIARAMLDGVRDLGLPWSGTARRLQGRIMAARAAGAPLPDYSDDALMERLESWLLPYLGTVRTAAELKALDLVTPLLQALSWEERQILDRNAPAHFTTPLGNRIPVDYATGQPAIEVRLQEMFGLAEHPRIAGQPLRITLLSPARRPLQTTTDLPGFWVSSYTDVRKEMRGRYPKHPWPEDPAGTAPTLRTRPRR